MTTDAPTLTSGPPSVRPVPLRPLADQRNRAPTVTTPTVTAPTVTTPTVTAPTVTAPASSAHEPRTSRRKSTTSQRPSPLPKRPKGRLFVGAVVLGVLLYGTYVVWNVFFRYAAYGTVEGRIIRVSAPWRGVVDSLQVREGDHIHQGQVVATLQDLKLEQQIARIGDDLKIARAKLESEVLQLKWQSQQRNDHHKKALAEYYQLWGELLQERASLEDLSTKLARLERLRRKEAVTAEQLETTKFAVQGQKAKVEKLEVAVKEMKKRGDIGQEQTRSTDEEFKPQLVRIESLQAELKRLRQNLHQGQVHAPVGGRVLKTHRFAGEVVPEASPLVQVLEENSLQAIIYLEQSRAGRLRIGETIQLRIEPIPKLVDCVVIRIGDQLQSSPASLARYYREHELLLPVYVEPKLDSKYVDRLRLGSEIRLPTSCPKFSNLLRCIKLWFQKHL